MVLHRISFALQPIKIGGEANLRTLAGRSHCFQRKATPGTGSYTWMGRIWEFINHKGFNK